MDVTRGIGLRVAWRLMPSFGEQLDILERWRRFPGRERAETQRAELVLTFDDGPDPDSTPAMLDALDVAGARATFFLVGEQIEAHTDIARDLIARGQEVAVHGMHHPAHPTLSRDEARDEVLRGHAAVAAVGVEPRFYRPPYGRFAEGSHEACLELGLKPVYWSAWGTDWETISAERITEVVAPDLEPGAIVLLHDSPRYAHRPSAAPTVEAIPLIAARAQERGLSLVTLSASLSAE
jgi:peptidoglycan/xylan/chitin deacetylase (PgdA/CDA1 family)